ncbi:hypothetical protein [Pseudomonas sp. S35]|nr:hypothetical protein [Pseudomonas sp. S35]
MTEYQPVPLCLNHRYREQAPSPIGLHQPDEPRLPIAYTMLAD